MRRKGRVCAFPVLYQLDVAGELEAATADTVSTALLRFWQSFEPMVVEDRLYAERLVAGAVAAQVALDARISQVSHNWRVARMGKVDRNLLRLAAYEILYCPDIPRTASINEAIEMAKQFGGGESPAFVNGILDQLVPDKLGPRSEDDHIDSAEVQGLA